MSKEQIKQDILDKIRLIASETGKAPSRDRFLAETGIKPHLWQGKFWRSWGDALIEAGLTPNELQGSFSDDELLQSVMQIAKNLDRFPSSGDITFELHGQTPGAKTILARWKMGDLADNLRRYAADHGEHAVATLASNYVPLRRPPASGRDFDGSQATGSLGYVYMQRHGTDYKVGYTNSLNKRGRQIQIELPQEIELVHSILTDDPAGVEGYWHRRFADKRTRGEWFKLTKADVAAFKKWSKIW